MNNIGSSETTRESLLSPFNFDDYLKNHQPQHKNSNNTLKQAQSHQHFLEWFLGMTEGDGYFGFRKQGGQNRLQFAIGQKDEQVLRYIRTQLGWGKVGPDFTASQGFRFVVEDQEGIRRMMALLNGNLVLPKRRVQFTKWIEAGARFLDPLFIPKDKTILPTLEDKWISGFIEAEGCFYATLTTPSQRSKISKRLVQKVTITQKDTFGESKILTRIGNLFSWSGNLSTANKETNCFRLEMGSLEQHKRIRDYINRFSLEGKKNISFERWNRVLRLRIEKQHLVDTNIPKLQTLCSQINEASSKESTFRQAPRALFEDFVQVIE